MGHSRGLIVAIITLVAVLFPSRPQYAATAVAFEKEKAYMVALATGENVAGEFKQETLSHVFIKNPYSLGSLKIEKKLIRSFRLMNDAGPHAAGTSFRFAPQLSLAGDIGYPVGWPAGSLK